jgi:hypothetical protein
MTDTTTNRFDLAHLVVLHGDDRGGYRPVCSCGWHGPWNDYLRAAEVGGEHRDGAVGRPDDLDRAMTELLDLQDDLAEAVVWLVENWSADLPGPYVRTATHYASDEDRQGKAGVRLLVPCEADELAVAALRLGAPVIDDPTNDGGDIRYRRATRAIGRVHIEAFARMEDMAP